MLVVVAIVIILTVLAGSHMDRTTGAMVHNFWNEYTLIQTATDASFFAVMAIGATLVMQIRSESSESESSRPLPFAHCFLLESADVGLLFWFSSLSSLSSPSCSPWEQGLSNRAIC